MDRLDRRSRADRVLAGYDSGPGATGRVRDAALARAEDARMVVLVEGISDLMALDAVAERQGRDLAAEGIVVVPVGGAHAFEQHLGHLGNHRVGVRCLVDEAEEAIVRGAIATIASTGDATGSAQEGVGICVCVEDLEDELIQAVTPSGFEAILEREGDLGSFRSLQRQPAWRDGDLVAQLRRFLGAGSRRKLRYARILALELEPEDVPRPLACALQV